jgi:ankyrin repeat protein
MAVVKGNLKFVEALYKKGAFLNYQNAAGDTALTLSISSKHIDITKYLIEKGVNVNLQNIFGISSLHLAVMQNRSEIVEALIKAGSDLNMKDNQGYTPLCMASHPDIARMLIQNGAEVNPTKGACPPLIEAAKDDKLDIVEVLLKNKADIDAIYDGKTALLCAIKANNITIVKKLIFAGARLNLELYKTQPLVHAAVNDREEADYTDDMVECLLEHGVDVIEPDDENYSDYVNSLLDIAKFTDLLLKGKVDSQLFRGIIDDLDENMKIVSIYNFIFLRNEGKLTHFEIYNNLKEVYASLLNLESELSSIQAEATRGFIKSTLSRNIAAIIYNAVKSGLSENDNTTIFLELINEAFKKNIISEENYSNYIEQLDSTILLEGMVYEVVGLPKDNNPIILSFNNNYHEKFKELYKWLREDKNADLFRNLLKQYYNKITDNDTVEQAWNCLINLSAIEFKWDMKLLNDLLQLDVFRANGNISTEENKFKYKKAFIFHCAHPEYGDVNKFLEDEGYLQQIKDACLSEESDTYAAKTFIKLLTKSVLPASIKQKVNVILKEILTEKPELFMEEEFPMRIVKLESDNSLEPNSKKSVDSQDASNDKAEFLTLSEAQDTAIDVAIVDDGFLDVTGVTS